VRTIKRYTPKINSDTTAITLAHTEPKPSWAPLLHLNQTGEWHNISIKTGNTQKSSTIKNASLTKRWGFYSRFIMDFIDIQLLIFEF
jgi:hypothetical protein